MPSSFLDSSALVKRQVTEPGHTWVHALCVPSAGNEFVLAELTLVEVPAAYAGMARQTPRRISIPRRDRLIADFERAAAGQYIIIEATRPVLLRAAALCRVHPLRAYDAVQLACALTRRDDDLAAGRPVATFVCADANLLATAQAEGLAVDDPTTHP